MPGLVPGIHVFAVPP